MPTIDEIIEFVREETGYDRPITPETNLQHDIGVFGDDMSAFLDAYAGRFTVDMSKHLWYFHTGEEGPNIGAAFFDPPYRRVSEMPITIQMLHDFANRGEWSVAYPFHVLPERRYDILINQVFLLLTVLIIVAVLVVRMLR